MEGWSSDPVGQAGVTHEEKPMIRLIGTGGTIAALASDATDFHDYPISGQRLSSQELVALVPEIADFADICHSPSQPVSSTEIGPAHWRSLLDEIANMPSRVSGVVITHGTATLEETAFALDLFCGSRLPIVLTGAQRPSNVLSSDAAFNLWSACRVATDRESLTRGVLVVFNGQIHAAADVSKASNFALEAFQSGPLGPLGTVEGTEIRFHRRRDTPSPELDWPNGLDWPRVEIVMSFAGADGAPIRAAVDNGALGLVVAGLAPGYATPDQRLALQDARNKGVQVVMSTRAAHGPTTALRQNDVDGLIGSRRLSPAKARILLTGALIAGATPAETDGLFAAFA